MEVQLELWEKFESNLLVWLGFEDSKEENKKILEAPGIDPGTSRMLSERSTIWATPPLLKIFKLKNFQIF